YSLVTRSSDGQMLFLANMLSKMKQDTRSGSRIAEVHNGSSLFTGDAGQGESNIRRWIIENDWLEAIVALPLNMFYNTYATGSSTVRTISISFTARRPLRTQRLPTRTGQTASASRGNFATVGTRRSVRSTWR